MRPLRPLVAASLLGVLALAGCGGTDTGSPAANPTGATFPVTIEAANGSVAIPEAPKRIVSLSPTATEMLFAIGAGKQVVAVDDNSSYPAEAPRTKLSGFQPNAEAVIGYNPDLVVLSNDTGGIVKALQAVKIPVLLETSAVKIEDTYNQIDDLGAATGHRDKAADVVDDMKKKLAEAVSGAGKPEKPLRYYYELDNTYFSVTSKTFIGSLLAPLGLVNIADAADKQNTGFPQLSAEYIVKADPQLIFLADTKCCGQSLATVTARPGWSSISAVRDKQVVALDDDIASRWGPRVVDLVRAAAAAVAEAEPTT